MLERMGGFFADKVRKILPETFIVAIIFTILAILLAAVIAGAGPMDIVESWVLGVFDPEILSFAILMIMILTFGFTIGVSPPFVRFFNWLAKLIKKPWQVYFFLTIISIVLMLINWGLAPVLAILAIEICKRVKGVDYRLAIAAFYSGLLVWHGGLSSSAALMMATRTTAQSFVDRGIISDIIPVSSTLLSSTNFVLIASVVVLLPVLVLFLRPKKVDEKWDPAVQYEKKYGKPGDFIMPDTPPDKSKMSSVDKLNNSPVLSIFLFLLCILGFAGIIMAEGFNLAAIAFLMLGLGVLLQWRPTKFLETMKGAITGSAEIVILFPLFGGVMGIFSHTGLATVFAEGLLNFANEVTLPWFSFVIASIINLFIPSGGAEWLVVGPPVLEAATMVGADTGKTILGFAYGDALTNLINPFWTLTFLPIVGQLMNIKPRDFMGYTALICLIYFVIFSVIILLV